MKKDNFLITFIVNLNYSQTCILGKKPNRAVPIDGCGN